MNNTSKLAIGLGIASSALVATWLLTGDRKKKTTEYLAKKAKDLKRTLRKTSGTFDDSEVHYV